jgi:hypothetical protein
MFNCGGQSGQLLTGFGFRKGDTKDINPKITRIRAHNERTLEENRIS